METVVELLTKIENRLVVIEDRLSIVEKGCGKMENHITFIEQVYSSLKKPISAICNYFETGPKKIK